MVSDISKFEVGDHILPLNIELVTKESLKRYADASGDPNLIHLNKEFAQKHGLPDVIQSDRDTRFLSQFWKQLWKRCGTRLAMSTSYHPQSIMHQTSEAIR